MQGDCNKPERFDDEPCPLDTGEYADCSECDWFTPYGVDAKTYRDYGGYLDVSGHWVI